MKKLATVMFTMMIFILLGNVDVSANENVQEIPESEIDNLLLDLEVPSDVIDELTYYGKLNIYNSIDTNAVFDGYTEEDVELPENDIQLLSIPKSQLQLKVSAFKNSDGTYSFYPSFIWKTKARLRNDSFGFALHDSNWTTVAGNVGLNIHMVNAIPGINDYFYYDRATTSNFAGHVFKIPKGDGATNHLHYEGHAHFKAKSKKSTIDKRIILSYSDDTTTGGSASYSISIGAFSVSFPGGGSNKRETSETLAW